MSDGTDRSSVPKNVGAPRLMIEAVGSALELTSEQWEPLARDRSFYVTRPWLHALERDHAFRAVYLTAREPDSSRVVGILPTYLWNGRPGVATSLYDLGRLFFDRTLVEDVRVLPLLLLGSRAGYMNDPLLHPALSADERKVVLRALLDAAQEWADEAGAHAVALLYLDPRAAHEWGDVAPEAKLLLTNADARLDVSWPSFEGYLASRSSKQRWSTQRELRVFSRSRQSLSRGALSRYAQEAARLSAELQQKYGHHETTEAMSAALSAQAACVDDQSHVFAARVDEALTGFVLFYLYGGVLYGRMAGFHPSASRDFVYFNLAFYEPIRFAIENGVRTIDLGTGSWQAKVLRGAKLMPLWSIVFKPRDLPEPVWAGLFNKWNEYAVAAQRRRTEELCLPFDASAWMVPSGEALA